MKTITVTIPRKGISTGASQVKIETEGFNGQGCTAATEAMQAMLGKTSDQELKAEYYQTNDEQVEYLTEGGG